MGTIKVSIFNTHPQPLMIVLEPFGQDFTLDTDEKLFFRTTTADAEPEIAVGTGDDPYTIHLSFETSDNEPVSVETSTGKPVQVGYNRELLKDH